MPPTSEYEKTLTHLKAEAAELIRQRQHIDGRLAALKQAIDGLNALTQRGGSRPKSDESAGGIGSRGSPGLSDSIRDVLSTAGTPLSPTEIRDRLVRERQFKPEQYANFLTAVHNTLHRLVMSQDIGFAEFAGRNVYLPMPRPEDQAHAPDEGTRARRSAVYKWEVPEL